MAKTGHKTVLFSYAHQTLAPRSNNDPEFHEYSPVPVPNWPHQQTPPYGQEARHPVTFFNNHAGKALAFGIEVASSNCAAPLMPASGFLTSCANSAAIAAIDLGAPE